MRWLHNVSVTGVGGWDYLIDMHETMDKECPEYKIRIIGSLVPHWGSSTNKL